LARDDHSFFSRHDVDGRVVFSSGLRFVADLQRHLHGLGGWVNFLDLVLFPPPRK